MNAPESPLTPETLDELLSAEIDGELASAAADLGLTLDEATAAIAAAPEASQRRLALTNARDLLATRAPLSKSVELRLVGTALDRSIDQLRAARERPRRARQVLAAVGAAAAAAAVIAGVVVLAGTNSSTDSKASLSVPLGPFGSPVTHPSAPHVALVAFGEVSDPSRLGAEVEARLSVAPVPLTPPNLPSSTGAQGLVGQDGGAGGVGPEGPTGPQGVTGPPGAQGPGPTGALGAIGAQGPTGPTGPQGAQSPHASPAIAADGIAPAQGVQGNEGLKGAQGSTGPSSPLYNRFSPADHTAEPVVTANAARVCTATIRRRADLASAPVLSGTGTSVGTPAVVAVFGHGHGYVVYVLAARDCSLLSQQMLP